MMQKTKLVGGEPLIWVFFELYVKFSSILAPKSGIQNIRGAEETHFETDALPLFEKSLGLPNSCHAFEKALAFHLCCHR